MEVDFFYRNLAPTDLMTKLVSCNQHVTSEMTYEFWDAPDTISWFQERGYTLYNRVLLSDIEMPWTVPKLPFDDVLECKYPYAGYDTTSVKCEVFRPLCTFDTTGKIIYAQDLEGHHVAIKIILEDSDEYRISRFLNEQTLDTMQQNCIMPVLELLTYKEGLYFAVMPRWGEVTCIDRPSTTREILNLMYAMLKGLAFLHDHNIIHQDIKEGNVLINHYMDDVRHNIDVIQRKLRSQGKLIYAMIDFNVSHTAPAETNRKEYTLPYFKSWPGTIGCQPYDTTQWEYEYNPFVYDVGCLGVVFDGMFRGHERYIPMLAPLIDMMTTRDLSRRFTATEALYFFQQFAMTDPDQLDTKHNPERSKKFRLYFDHDRWSALPPDFQEKWAVYREPPVPKSIRVMRWVYFWLADNVSPHITPYIRWFFSKILSLPRAGWTCFMGLNWPTRESVLKGYQAAIASTCFRIIL